MAKQKYVYRFGEGSAQQRDLLGGKGANLSEMARLGLPVPPGSVISTEACRQYNRLHRRLPDGLWEDVQTHLHEVEAAVGRTFGDRGDPLLVSVRSGAKFSMPGMMDTILNLGLNDDTTAGLAAMSGNERFALDSHRRFLQLFGKVVLRVPSEAFEDALAEARESAGVATDAELKADQLRSLVQRFKAIIGQHSSEGVPDDPWQQLRMAIEAVFDSWSNRRAVAYREHHHIPHDLGTAVTIMAMVFGNLGWNSGSGVCFSRNPADGTRELYGEYLPNAQGEDVVSGARTPNPIAELAKELPEAYNQLQELAHRLEVHYRDVQDIEFTIENGTLYMLQTRAAKRTSMAAIKAAVAMVEEELISAEEALSRVSPNDLAQVLLPRFDEGAKEEAVREGRLLGRGLNASPGAAAGVAVFDADTAIARAAAGETVILVRRETSADDVPGILHADAVLTSRGGITSHAAVVTRGLGKPAVVGCDAIRVDHHKRHLSVDGTIVREGDHLSLDGFTGEVFVGSITMVKPEVSQMGELATLLTWADNVRRLHVWANADGPRDAEQALSFGADGIGLCRTEHMFFHQERLPMVRRMLLVARSASELELGLEEAQAALEEAEGPARRDAEEQLSQAQAALEASQEVKDFRSALERLEEFQRQDFLEILRVMQGKPVVIRLLDAPLHEFLPPYESLLKEVMVLRSRSDGDAAAQAELAEKEELLEATKELQEANPMLGHRGCRLGLTYPDIYELQVRAVVEAACQLLGEGVDVRPEIMIPMVSDAGELRLLTERLKKVVEEVKAESGVSLEIPFGTMIELPRAALTAGELARYAAFFSFGSNDLTQMTFGFSRDDAEEKFLRYYVRSGILPANPYDTLDEAGVGRLIRLAVQEGRLVNPQLEIGLCGEHGGDAKSVAFCHRVGLDYVSCSPPRIPMARLAAAQAVLGERERDV